MMTTLSNPVQIRPQSGAALITGLIFLVVLTMIGVTAARMSSLEERMSGNMRDRSLAMQAAELALRDAERDILRQGTGGRNPPISGLSDFAVSCNNDTTANSFDDGLCYRPTTTPTYTATTIEWPAFTYNSVNYVALSLDMTAAPSVAYGRFTGATAIAGVSAQPRYIIEGIERYCWLTCSGTKTAGYRITVRAVGANPSTVVWLQETYKP